MIDNNVNHQINHSAVVWSTVWFLSINTYVCMCACKCIAWWCPLQLWCCPHSSSECSKSQALLPCPTGKPDHCCRQHFIIWSTYVPGDTLGSAHYSWQAQESLFIPCSDLISVCLCGFYLAFNVKLICPERYKLIQSNWKGCAACCDPREVKKQSDRVVEVWFSEARRTHGKLKRGWKRWQILDVRQSSVTTVKGCWFRSG